MYDLPTNAVIIALGANRAGILGPPAATLRRTLLDLATLGCGSIQVSRLYSTRPVGLGRQEQYLNAVVRATCWLPPARLLAQLKRLERLAGRRVRAGHAPRPLDLDLIAYGGRRIAWRKSPVGRPRLVLPHPQMHRRAFVLLPLLDVAPHWCHPVLGRTGRQLLASLRRVPHDVEPVLDSTWATCQKNIR